MATNKIYVGEDLIAENYGVYNDMLDKPTINGCPMQGYLTNDDVNIYSKERIDELIENSKEIRTYPDESSFVPEPNIQYYIGPDENGDYVVQVYTEDGEKIILGDTKTKVDTIQEKLPITNGRYDIGHNPNVTDNRILSSHKVTDSINELDSLSKPKLNIVNNGFETTQKSTSGAINEVNTKLNKIVVPFSEKTYHSDRELMEYNHWKALFTFERKSSTFSKNFYAYAGITFWIFPYFSESKQGVGSANIQPSLFHFTANYHQETGDKIEYLTPIINTKQSILNYYPFNFMTLHNGTTHHFMIGAAATNGMNFKVKVLQQDIGDMKYTFMSGKEALANPAGATYYPISLLGYTDYLYT